MSNKQLLIETHTIKISPKQLTENVNKENWKFNGRRYLSN